MRVVIKMGSPPREPGVLTVFREQASLPFGNVAEMIESVNT
jgi:hypothetical protein